MMEKSNPQLELFQKEEGLLREKSSASRNFLSYARGWEKTIVLIIAFLVTGIVSFCVGVEKGKNEVLAKSNLRLDTASRLSKPVASQVVAQNVAQSVQPAAVAPKTGLQAQDPEVSVANNGFISKYTIQVASYKTKASAQKEAQMLKKKGLSTLILTKGKYTVLCVGSFRDKQAAGTLLAELKKKYKSCLLRRM